MSVHSVNRIHFVHGPLKCVRLSRLLVGFRMHFKSLHFHFHFIWVLSTAVSSTVSTSIDRLLHWVDCHATSLTSSCLPSRALLAFSADVNVKTLIMAPGLAKNERSFSVGKSSRRHAIGILASVDDKAIKLWRLQMLDIFNFGAWSQKLDSTPVNVSAACTGLLQTWLHCNHRPCK